MHEKKSCNSAVYYELGIILLEIFMKQKIFFSNLRHKFIKLHCFRRSSVLKLIQLFCSANEKEINNLGKYLYFTIYVNKLRFQYLKTTT